ncbi:MAG: hypothetical protein KAJ18_09545 [Candidatus Omnitrophica bacterium]|nr:hypothetical protein [Candidatus Omnitrophota bacterium]
MKKIFFTFFIVSVVLTVSPSCAQEGDLQLIGESQYFSIYGYKDLDIRELLFKLNFNHFLQVDSFLEEGGQGPENILAKTMDALYLEISDILGIHIYSFRGNIKFYPDQASLNKVFRNFFEKDFHERSFYLHEKKTIYVSFADLTLGMLGHEAAHAIISHYFVVPPPEKVQEVLSGYVEFSLRKLTGSLQ